MKSQSKTVRDIAVKDFRVCMRILDKMQNLYSAAEVTVGFLETVMPKKSLAGVIGPAAEQLPQAGRLTQGDSMAIIQYLKAHASQAVTRDSPVASSTWNRPEQESNSSNQPQVLHTFGDIGLNVENDLPSGELTDVTTQDVPYRIEPDFDPSQINTWVAERNQDWEMV
ncbi:hypothetical protein ACLX1H_005907 [Fusarium chlamydosporum]